MRKWTGHAPGTRGQHVVYRAPESLPAMLTAPGPEAPEERPTITIHIEPSPSVPAVDAAAVPAPIVLPAPVVKSVSVPPCPVETAAVAQRMADAIDERLSNSEHAATREAHDRAYANIGRAIVRALLECDVSLHIRMDDQDALRPDARPARSVVQIVPTTSLSMHTIATTYVQPMTDSLARAADAMLRKRREKLLPTATATPP